MIDWIKSAEINGCIVKWLKDRFERFPKSEKLVWWICDGKCGTEKIKRFRYSHNMCLKCANKTSKHRKAISDARIKHCNKKMNPLPSGQTISIPKNKNCAPYLGCIAEELLAKTFKDVQRMPPNNRGYDIICNQDFKIDVKSSATGYKGRWMFSINKNIIADHFLCVGFESRNELTPTHVWLIPANVINCNVTITISKTTLNKWAKYEQPLDRVLACCEIMQPKGL